MKIPPPPALETVPLGALPDASSDSMAEDPKASEAGALHYTSRGAVVLFTWLLWGDFAYVFFESIFGRFIPLYLKDLQASNTLIGIMTGSLAGLVNVFFLPHISRWSDRHRGPRGRRIPFLYVVTPLVAFSLIAIGFIPEIAGWIGPRLIARIAPSISVGTLKLTLLCVFVVTFHFFNMVLVNAYTWLLKEVVPQKLMARFLSWFRIIGTISSFAFLWYVFPHLMARRREAFLGVGLFYLVTFLLMCRNVKEGAHPPPPEVEDRPGLMKSFADYFRECLSIPLYRAFFISYVLVVLATSCAGPFSMLFARDTIGLDMDFMGKTFAWGAVASMLVYVPFGWLCDRFSPMHMALGGLIGFMASCVLAYLLVQGKTSFLVYTFLSAIPGVAWGLGSQATTMALFPKERFGQFSSGLNVFACGALVPGNFLMGQFMDLVHSNYRMSFLWSMALFAVAIYPMLLVMREWKRHGGPDCYVPPLPLSIAAGESSDRVP